jgi:hypothetical protein
MTFQFPNSFQSFQIYIFIFGALLVVFAIIGQIVFPKIDTILLKESWKKVLLAIFGIALIAFSVVWGGPPLPPPDKHTSTPTAIPAPPTAFSVTEVKLKSGKILQIGQSYPVQSYPVVESPITITGTYSPQGSGNVWVFVKGHNGDYYLQKPKVQFADSGQWTASNIITAAGTIMVVFVYVMPQGQNSFQRMVDDGTYDFPSLPLPDVSKELKDIPIQVIAG